MSSTQKIDQKMTDKIYHVYEENKVVAHSISEEELDIIYDPEKHEYEELNNTKFDNASY